MRAHGGGARDDRDRPVPRRVAQEQLKRQLRGSGPQSARTGGGTRLQGARRDEADGLTGDLAGFHQRHPRIQPIHRLEPHRRVRSFGVPLSSTSPSCGWSLPKRERCIPHGAFEELPARRRHLDGAERRMDSGPPLHRYRFSLPHLVCLALHPRSARRFDAGGG